MLFDFDDTVKPQMHPVFRDYGEPTMKTPCIRAELSKQLQLALLQSITRNIYEGSVSAKP